MLDVLLVAATERELDGRDGLVCGVGPVEAAAATARALALRSSGRRAPRRRRRRPRSPPARTVVVGTEAIYADIAAGIPVPSSPSRIPGSLRLPALLSPRRPPSRSRRARPSAADGLRSRALAVEAMEGFGVLRAAALAGVPALEVRAVSNEIGEADRSRWDIAGAVAALQAALPLLLAALAARGDGAGSREGRGSRGSSRRHAPNARGGGPGGGGGARSRGSSRCGRRVPRAAGAAPAGSCGGCGRR